MRYCPENRISQKLGNAYFNIEFVPPQGGGMEAIMQQVTNRLRYPIILLVMICVFVALPSHTYAANYKYLSVQVIAQQKSNWCWLASSQMMGRYYNTNSTLTQSQIAAHVIGTTANVGGTLSDAEFACHYASVNTRTFYI
jgi:hypothetical protein